MENALKYGDGRRVELIFPEDDECVQIAVTNGGCTLGKDDLPHIFESFWRGANAETFVAADWDFTFADSLCAR